MVCRLLLLIALFGLGSAPSWAQTPYRAGITRCRAQPEGQVRDRCISQVVMRKAWIDYRSRDARFDSYENLGVLRWSNSLVPGMSELRETVRRLLRDIRHQLTSAEVLRSQRRFADATDLVRRGVGTAGEVYSAAGISCTGLAGVDARARCAGRMLEALIAPTTSGMVDPVSGPSAGLRGAVATALTPLAPLAACLPGPVVGVLGTAGIHGGSAQALEPLTEEARVRVAENEYAQNLRELEAQGPVVEPRPTLPRETHTATAQVTEDAYVRERRRRIREQAQVDAFIAALAEAVPVPRTLDQLEQAARREVARVSSSRGLMREDALLFAYEAELRISEVSVIDASIALRDRKTQWEGRLERYSETARLMRSPRDRRIAVIAAVAEDYPEGTPPVGDEVRAFALLSALSQVPRVLDRGESLGIQIFQDRVVPVLYRREGRSIIPVNLWTGAMIEPPRGKFFPSQEIYSAFIERLRARDPAKRSAPVEVIALPEAAPRELALSAASRSQAPGAHVGFLWPSVTMAFEPRFAPEAPEAAPVVEAPLAETPPPARATPGITQRPDPVGGMLPLGEVRSWALSDPRRTRELRRVAAEAVRTQATGAAMPHDFARFMMEVEATELRGISSRRRERNRQEYENAQRNYEKTLQVIRRQISTITDPSERFNRAMELLVERHLVKYYRDDAGILSGFTDGPGFNCQGATQVILGAIHSLGLTPPPGQEVGVQAYSDHVQAVLYERATGRVQILLTGSVVTGVEAPIYSPGIAWVAYLGRRSPLGAEAFLIAALPAGQGNGSQPGSWGQRNRNLSWPGAQAHFSDAPVPERSTVRRGGEDRAPRLRSAAGGASSRRQRREPGVELAMTGGGGASGLDSERRGDDSGDVGEDAPSGLAALGERVSYRVGEDTTCTLIPLSNDEGRAGGVKIESSSNEFSTNLGNDNSQELQYTTECSGFTGANWCREAFNRFIDRLLRTRCQELRVARLDFLAEVNRRRWNGMGADVRAWLSGESTELPLSLQQNAARQRLIDYLAASYPLDRAYIGGESSFWNERAFVAQYPELVLDLSRIHLTNIPSSIENWSVVNLFQALTQMQVRRLSLYNGNETTERVATLWGDIRRLEHEFQEAKLRHYTRNVQSRPLDLFEVTWFHDATSVFDEETGQSFSVAMESGTAILHANRRNGWKVLGEVAPGFDASGAWRTSGGGLPAETPQEAERRRVRFVLEALVARAGATPDDWSEESSDPAMSMGLIRRFTETLSHLRDAYFPSGASGDTRVSPPTAQNLPHIVTTFFEHSDLRAEMASGVRSYYQQLLGSELRSIAENSSTQVVMGNLLRNLRSIVARCLLASERWGTLAGYPETEWRTWCSVPTTYDEVIARRSDALREQIQQNPSGVFAGLTRLAPEAAERQLSYLSIDSSELARLRREAATLSSSPGSPAGTGAMTMNLTASVSDVEPLIRIFLAPGLVRVGQPPPARAPEARPPATGERRAAQTTETLTGLSDLVWIEVEPTPATPPVAEPTERRRRVDSRAIYIPTRERYARMLLLLIHASRNDQRLIDLYRRQNSGLSLDRSTLTPAENQALDRVSSTVTIPVDGL